MQKKQTKKNQVSIEKKRKQDLIWASGHYLGQHLPQDFDKWTDKKLNKYLEEWHGNRTRAAQVNGYGNKLMA